MKIIPCSRYLDRVRESQSFRHRRHTSTVVNAMWRGLLWTAALSCSILAEGRNLSCSLHDGRTSEDTFADVLSEVLRTSRTKDVLLMLRDSSSDGWANDILGKISATTSGHVLTLYVNACRAGPQSPVSSSALSRDLVVYVYVSERGPDIVENELIAEDIRRFVQARVRPKVLVLMILRRASHDLSAFFRATWSRRLLDVIVVEYAERERSTIVRRYDPFTDRLTEEPYSAEVAWFANDFPNMRGYPLSYVFNRRPPYSDVTTVGQTRTMKGVDRMVIKTLMDKMNFTGVPRIVMEYIYFQKTPNGTTYGILPDLIAGKYDALLNTLPMFGTTMGYTDTVFIEKWCFVVPGLLVKQNFMDSTAVLSFLMSFLIVGIFWLCSRLMRLDPDRWHPVKIVGIMLTSSFPPQPTRLCERIVFLSIFAACARYSTILFAELTSISLDSNRYVRFDRLQDLMHSNLVLMMQSYILNKIVEENSVLEHHIHKLGKEVIDVPDMDVCLENLLAYQNVSCFMEEGWAKLAAVNNMRDGRIMLRTTKLCYLSPPVGYIFPKGSPYIRRVSDILLMLAEGGIRNKWHHDYLRNETKETSIEMDPDETDFMFVSVFRPILYVLISGYSISALIFIGELIWKHFDINLSIC